MSSDWSAIRAVVLERDKFKCVDCEKDLARDGGHVHHLMPRALGGSHEPSNLISLCQICHASVHPNLQSRLARQMLEGFYVAYSPGEKGGVVVIGAGDGIRTHDPNLGKVVLYP